MADISADIDIQASPETILDVLADLARYPTWSAVHKKATVETRYPGGRPKRAVMAVTAAGLTDEQTLEYAWHRNSVEWDLVHAGQQKGQHGSYSIRSGHDGVSHVHYELRIDPSIPVPGLIVRRVMKKAVTAATEGLKQRVESLG